MNRRTALTLMTMGLLSLAVALLAGNAAAQQKGHVSYNASQKTPRTHRNSISRGTRAQITSCGYTSFVASSPAMRQ